MQCQFCTNTATVHVTGIVQRQPQRWHLCEACAVARELIAPPKGELHIPAILQLLLRRPDSPAHGFDSLMCPHCGLHYSDFRKYGRLGCPEDFEAFRPALEPLLAELQSARHHLGKIPESCRADDLILRAARPIDVDRVQHMSHEFRAALEADALDFNAPFSDLIRRKDADESR